MVSVDGLGQAHTVMACSSVKRKTTVQGPPRLLCGLNPAREGPNLALKALGFDEEASVGRDLQVG